MAWLDFIKAIRMDEEEEEERKKRGGVGNRLAGMLDDALDVGERGAEEARDFFAADPDKIRARDVVRETPKTLVDLNKGATNLARDVVREIPRSAAKLVGSLAPDELLEDAEKGVILDPSKQEGAVGSFNRFLYGDDPLKVMNPGSRDIAEEDRGGFLETGPVGVGLAVTDLTTGGASKQVAKRLAKESTVDGVKQVLKSTSKYADDVIDSIAPTIAKTTDVNTISDTIKRAGKGDVSAPVKPPTAPGPKESYGEAADSLLGKMKTSDEVAEMTKKGKGQQFREQYVDRLSPVNDFVRLIEDKTGRKLATEENPYERMRLFSGMSDIVQQRVTSLSDTLKQAPDLDAVRVIGTGRQTIDRQQRGLGGVVDEDTARKAIEDIRTKLGDEEFDKAARVVDEVNDYNKTLLNELYEAGEISDDAMKAIEDVGANYFSRFNVIEYMTRNDQNRSLFARGGSYNETKQALQKVLGSAKGMKEGTEILDPIESIVISTDRALRSVNRNKIWQKFDDLADEVPDMVVRIRDPANVAKKMSLGKENKVMRPVRNKLERILKTRNQQARRLESEVNRFEKEGLKLSLKGGGERMTDDAFQVAGLGGRAPTSQTGKVGNVGGAMDLVNPQKLGPQDTSSFLRNLIENGSRSDIDKIKKKVGNRDAKLTQLLDEVGEIKSQYDDIAGTIRKNVDEAKELIDAQIPEGFELLTGFRNGIEGKIAVPKEVAEVYTGKSTAQQDYMTGIMGKVHGFVKQNLTANNPVFALISNPIRDAKTFAYNSRNVKGNPFALSGAYMRGLFGRVMNDADYDAMIKAGGKSGFYSDERTGAKIASDAARGIGAKRSVKSLGFKTMPINNAKDFAREMGRVATAPLRGVRDKLHGAASVLEDTPRLAEFKAAKKAGKSDMEAAFDARDVTVDFQQMGRHGQILNAWVPFLNARGQGVLKSAKAIKRDPARATGVYAALTAAPIAALALNNNQYPEVLKMIPDDTRDNNFVFVLGDGKDEHGDYNQVLTIPKSEVDQILGNPLENLVRWMADDDPDSLVEMVTKSVDATIPIDVTKDGKFNPSRAVGSTVLASPVAKVPAEYITGHNFYFDSPLMSQQMEKLPAGEQVRKDDPYTEEVERGTSPVAEFLAKLTGGSPIKTENAARGVGLGFALDRPDKQLGNKLTGVTANKMQNEFYSTLNKTAPNKNSVSNYINEAIGRGDYEAANQAAETYNAYLREQFEPFADRYGNEMTPELIKAYEDQKINLSSRSIGQRLRSIRDKQAGR